MHYDCKILETFQDGTFRTSHKTWYHSRVSQDLVTSLALAGISLGLKVMEVSQSPLYLLYLKLQAWVVREVDVIQRITWFVLLTLIHSIVTYPMDSVVQLSKNVLESPGNFFGPQNHV